MVGPAGESRCRGATWSRSTPRWDEGSRGARPPRRVCQRTQPPMRQPRRARRERVEMKHDEDLARRIPGTWPRTSANSSHLRSSPILAAIASPGSPRACGEISPAFAKCHSHVCRRWRRAALEHPKYSVDSRFPGRYTAVRDSTKSRGFGVPSRADVGSSWSRRWPLSLLP